jgi:hypothetical protein
MVFPFNIAGYFNLGNKLDEEKQASKNPPKSLFEPVTIPP